MSLFWGHHTSKQKILIIGCSIAGLSAAEAARAKDPDSDITILSEESCFPYFRPRLCEVLEDREQAGKLLLHPEQWYAQHRFDIRLNHKAVRVKPDEKTVQSADGQTLEYDKLILASGSTSNSLPVKGRDLDGVETIWTMDDALHTEGRISKARRSIVIGGGLLGLEAAYALHKRGLDSLILERLPRLMMRQLDERSGEIFAAKVEHEGMHVTTEADIEEILADKEGKAAGVRLRDGSDFPADLILVSAGVHARIEYLEGSGIAADRCVTVDSRMRTNLKDVYAAGDCAVLDRHWYGLWSISKQQGAVAVENAAGGDREYAMPVPPYMVKAMGTAIASVGMVEEANLPREAMESLHRDIMENLELFQYAKKMYVDDTLSGFILLGDTRAFSSLIKQLGRSSDFI